MKIILFEVTKDKEETFRKPLEGQEVFMYEEKLTKDNTAKVAGAEVVSVFINSRVDKQVIDAMPNLKLICTRSTGFDHIDTAYCKSKGIAVANVPAYGSATVAEFTFALILSLSRKIFQAGKRLGEPGPFSIDGLQGFDLADKTIGVVGVGKIGKNVIKIAKGFGMKILACDSYPDDSFAQENDFEYVALDILLSQSDIVTLHAPYTKDNHHLINKERISFMKKGAYLFNTARGELVDTNALTLGLTSGHLGGAGLDVLEGEQEMGKDKLKALLDMPNVIITPHVAFYSKEAEARIIQTTTENIQNFLKNNLTNIVNE